MGPLSRGYGVCHTQTIPTYRLDDRILCASDMHDLYIGVFIVSSYRPRILRNYHLCVLPIGDGTKTGKSGTIYKPSSKMMQKIEERKSKEDTKSFLSTATSVHSKPLVCPF